MRLNWQHISTLMVPLLLAGALVTPLHGQGQPEPDDVAKIATGNPDAAFLDQLATNGIPAAIGELLSAQADNMASEFTKSAMAGTLNTDLITRKHFADRVANINQALGRLLAVMDVGGKVYTGNYEDAAWSAGLTVLTELAGTQAGKSTLAYVGCGSTAPVTAAVLAIQIYRESAKQVAQTKGAVQLENLYYSIESLVRERGRTLGEGDPFPVTPDNVDKVWRKVLHDTEFRNNFKQYVTDQLGKQFPEPGYFDTFDAYVADPIISLASGQPHPKGGWAAANLQPDKPIVPSTAEDRLEDTAKNRLRQSESELKTYIAGLIGTLNRAAKAEEQRVLAVKAVRELQAFFQKNGAEMEEGLRKLALAMKRLPEAAEWAKGAGARVDRYIKEKSTDSLSAERAMIVMYVRDVIRWIPDKGPLAEDRNRIYSSLRAAYESSLKGTEELNKEFAQLAKKPKVPKGEFNRDPESYFNQYFRDVIKPFEWDGSGGPERAKAALESFLEQGNFRGPKDPAQLPNGRKPLADVVIEAWNKHNYAVACGEGDFTPGEVPAPEKEATIEGYAEETRKKLQTILSSSPIYANGETRDAFLAAFNMAEQALASRVTLARTEHEETALWMSTAFAQYRDYALKLWQKASDVNAELSNFGCGAFGPGFGPGGLREGKYELAPEKGQGALKFMFSISSSSPATWTTDGRLTYGGKQVDLDGAADLLSKYAQSGIGKMSEQTGALLAVSVKDYFSGKAADFASVALEIRKNYGSLEQQVRAYCDSLESNAELWTKTVQSAQTDLHEIRKYVDPGFMQNESFDHWNRRALETPKWAKATRARATQLAGSSEQYASEWESDAFYMRRLGRLFDMWVQKGIDQGVLGQSGSYDTVGALNLGDLKSDGTNGPHYVTKPYAHFLTEAEKTRLISERKGDWQAAGLEEFAAKNAPWLKAIVDNYFEQLQKIRTFGEDNFLTTSSGGILMSPVTSTKLNAAEKLLNNMQPGTRVFEENFNALVSALPWQFEYPGDRSREKFRDLSPECLQAPLYPRYAALRDKFKEKLKAHRALEGQMAEDEQRKQIAEARSKLSGLLSTLRARLAQGEDMIKKSLELKSASEIQTAITKLNDYRTKLTDEPYPTARSYHDILYYATAKDGKSTDSAVREAKSVLDDVGKMSSQIANTVAQLTSRRDTPQDASEEVKSFYEEFRKAYEYKNDAKVMALIDDNWSAGDGTTVLDLEGYLRNSFTVFDEIKYAISNLKATWTGNNRYRVSYDVIITGKIYDNNIKHEEKSSVSEEVAVDSAGRMKITKTLDGKFWYVR